MVKIRHDPLNNKDNVKLDTTIVPEYTVDRQDFEFTTLYQCNTPLVISIQTAAVNYVGAGNFSQWYTATFQGSKL